MNALGIETTGDGRAVLEAVKVVCGVESARHLGVRPGYVIDPDEEPELFARHQQFATEQKGSS